jgi:ferredoxin
VVEYFMKQFDERDTMFARKTLRPGSEAYRDYYERHPEKKEIDDHLRSLSKKLKENPITDPFKSNLVDAAFSFLADINHFSEGAPAEKVIPADPQQITDLLKNIAQEYGADLVGIAKINKDHFYSHRGRKMENYGDPINCVHSYAIVFAVEMRKDKIDLAPAIEESIETSRIYVKISIVGMILAYYLRRLGYLARNHMDANYLLPLPSLAEEAGLGELGRIGFLVTKEFGPRVRLGAVTTNLDLVPDEKQSFGIREYCEKCHLCEKACLGHAIPATESSEDEGRHYWQTIGEKCYEIWKRIGTDCGVCMKVCPFSQSENEKKQD